MSTSQDAFAPLDASIAEVARLRGESRMTVLRKIKSGRYESYLSGGKRKVLLSSVLADRAAEIAANAVEAIPPGPGRGHKHKGLRP